MNIKLVFLLTSICVACLFIITGEWLYAGWSQRAVMKSLIPNDVKASLEDMPQIDLHKKPQDSYVDFVARPLFIKGRRPVDESLQEVATAQNVEIPIVFDWELIGIYSTEKGLSALFSRENGKTAKDKYRRVALGADLDGWKLSEAHQDKVIVKQGDQLKELLLRKVKEKVKDPSKKMNVPNRFNVPKPEDVQMPIQGELENAQ